MSSQPKVTLVFVQSDLLPPQIPANGTHVESFTALVESYLNNHKIYTTVANLDYEKGTLVYEGESPDGVIIPVITLSTFRESQITFLKGLANQKIQLPEGCIVFHPYSIYLQRYVPTENQQKINELITKGKIHLFEMDTKEREFRQVKKISTGSSENEYGLTLAGYLQARTERQQENEIPPPTELSATS